MPVKHPVAPGDGMTRVGFRYGFFPDTLWELPENAQLRADRGHPETLIPGDTIYVPDPRPKEARGATKRLHRFRRKGVPAWIRIRLLRDGEPRAAESYMLDIDGTGLQGCTDGEGWLREWVAPDARQAVLTLPATGEVYELDLGQLYPIDTGIGVQRRLRNLGYYDGPLHGQDDDETRAALARFQVKAGLPATGAWDETTCAALLSAHAS